jgi:TatD DNase family protein
VHVREAWEDVLRILEEERAEDVVLHCFSGDAVIAKESASRGYFLSFAGNVTYGKNGHLREAAAAVPVDRILVETDSPFLAPQSLRGRENSPANIPLVLEAVAAARAQSLEDLEEAISANARQAFPGLV